MGTVNGQVVCKESALGVKGLVVEALDVPSAETTDRAITHPKTRRLASGLTGADGSFRLTFEQPEAQATSINLLVAVSGPEEIAQEASHLFVSPRVRSQAASEESYLIQISEEVLKKVGVKPPGLADEGSRPATIAARRIINAAEDDVHIADAEQTALGLKIKRAATVAKQFNDDFRDKIKDRLSQVSETQAGSDTFVKDGDPVEKATQTLITADLSNIINEGGKKAAVKVRFALTDTQHRKIKDALTSKRISRDKLRQVLGANALADAVEYTAQSPLAVLSRELSDRQRAAAEALGVTVPPPPPPPPPPVVTGTTDVLGSNAASRARQRFAPSTTSTICKSPSATYGRKRSTKASSALPRPPTTRSSGPAAHQIPRRTAIR